METKQKQTIEAFQRVQAFLEAFPAPPPATYSAPKVVLGDVVAQLTDHSAEQVSGRSMSTAEERRQKRLVTILREHHLRPIVAIARATISDEPGIEAALRFPPAKLSVLKLIAEANAIRGSAALYEPAFVKNGRPADFLAQLAAAIDAVRLSMDGRARQVGRHIGAKAGLEQQLRRGRKAEDMLDSIVMVAFEGNDVVLAKWQNARKVQAIPGGGAAAPAVSADAPPKAA